MTIELEPTAKGRDAVSVSGPKFFMPDDSQSIFGPLGQDPCFGIFRIVVNPEHSRPIFSFGASPKREFLGWIGRLAQSLLAQSLLAESLLD